MKDLKMSQPLSIAWWLPDALQGRNGHSINESYYKQEAHILICPD